MYLINICYNCNKQLLYTVDRKCGRCLITTYCNRQCQKTHWKQHKKECIPANKETAEDIERKDRKGLANGTKRFMKYSSDHLKFLKQAFDVRILMDIKEYGKPAAYYNYNSDINIIDTKKIFQLEKDYNYNKAITTIDTEEEFQQEKSNLINKGLTVISNFKKELNFNQNTWEIIIWTFQCKDLDLSKWIYYSNQMTEPLAMSCGYMITGFCYIQLIKCI